MIILDTNILKGTSLRGPEAELLRAIRSTKAERVGAPWIVLEELAAQQALLYEEKYETAKAAVEELNRATPWDTVNSPVKETPDRVRKHWRSRYAAIVDTLPTSPTAYQGALFREANCLFPCKRLPSDDKTGARDAAIWLTAVEYARENPDATVYFVSKDSDFGDRSSFSKPMEEDLRGIEDRFVRFTSLGSVLTKFATEAEVDEAELTELLQRPINHKAIGRAAKGQFGFMAGILTAPAPGVVQEITCMRWQDRLTATVSAVNKIAAHEIAGHRWYTATVRWLISGIAESDHLPLGAVPVVFVNCAWETRVLLSPTAPSKGLTVIGSGKMVPPTNEDVPNLPAQEQFDPGVAELVSLDRQKRVLAGRHALLRILNEEGPYSGALLRLDASRRGAKALEHFDYAIPPQPQPTPEDE